MTHEITTQSQQRNVLTWFTPSSFEKAMQIAELMIKCGTMPVHLKGIGDCFRVVVQAAKWGMDPFAVGECTSLVHGRMCYEGKLVAAVLDSMGALEGGRLRFKITGKGQDSSIILTGVRRGETEELSIEGSVKQWRTHTFNKDGKELLNNWDKNPHDQLVYKGTRQWARIHAPAPLLGVYTRDEMEELEDVTASATVIPDAKPAKARKSPETDAPAPETKAAKPETKEDDNEPVVVTGADAVPNKPTVADLVKMVSDLVLEFGDAGMAAVREFNKQIGVKKTGECPPNQVEKAISLLTVFARELAEGATIDRNNQ